MTPSAPERSSVENIPAHAIHQTLYSSETCRTQDFTVAKEQAGDISLLPYDPESNLINWLHFVGIDNPQLLKKLLAPYGIHDLVIEDLLNHHQRPKVEEYDAYLFITARVFQYTGHKLVSDPVCLILGKNFVLTFQQRPLGLLSSIRKHITDSRTNLRRQNAAFLAYTFIDRLIDDYFIALDHFNRRVESLDKNLFDRNGTDTDMLPKIHRLKRDAVRLRRTLSPMRDMLGQLLRGDFPLFQDKARFYLRDAYDHLLQLSESLDAARDAVQSMMDIHLSLQSNRLNTQMRLLTVITILFMPLTLITGIYGMNFNNMPELHWKYGYFMVWGIMITVVCSLLIFFRRRKWI